MQSKRSRGVAFIALVAAPAAAALAGDLVVPTKYRTVESALAVAQPGDRILVKGARLRGVIVVRKSDVAIVGRGTTFVGRFDVQGDRVSVRGFQFVGRDNDAVGGGVNVTGGDAVIEENRFRNAEADVDHGARATIRNNRFDRGGVGVFSADGAVVRSNRIRRGEVRVGTNTIDRTNATNAVVEGNVAPSAEFYVAGSGHVVRANTAYYVALTDCPDGVVEGNVVRGTVNSFSLRAYGDAIQVRGNVAVNGISVKGDGVDVRGNSTGTAARFRTMGLKVHGNDAVVEANTITNTSFGVAVWGARPTIVNNTTTVGSSRPMDDAKADFQDCPGVWVQSDEPGGTIAGNHVTHTFGVGITVLSGGVTVSGNDLHGVGADTSITVVADGVVVDSNVVVHVKPNAGTGDGISVTGDDNVIRDNTIENVPQDAVAVISGNGNQVTGDVLTGADGCGIYVGDGATATAVSGCTVTGCDLGFVGDGGGATIAGSTLTGNLLADVLDLGAVDFGAGNSIGVVSHERLLLAAVR